MIKDGDEKLSAMRRDLKTDMHKSVKNSTSAFFPPQKLAQKTRKSANIEIRDKTA